MVDLVDDRTGRCRRSRTAVHHPVIYAEVSARFSRIEDVDDALPPEDYGRLAIPWDAAFLAGKAFLDYRRRGGLRSSTLPDFFIGAHAAVEGRVLLTRRRRPVPDLSDGGADRPHLRGRRDQSSRRP